MRAGARRRTARLAASVVLTLLAATSSYAQPGPRDKAAAEALFQHAARLFEESRFSEACEKFEASQELDPAIGTQLRLADCYDRVGRTASAWGLFAEVKALARAQGQNDRETIASERLSDLERRLSKLTLRLQPGARPPGLEIRLNGTSIPSASWDVPIPVDPGTQRVEAIAPGYRPWSTSALAQPGPSEQTLDVPRLVPLPAQTPSGDAATSTSLLEVDSSSTPATVWLGYTTGAVGIVGLGVAAFFGYRAYDLNDDSLNYCLRDDPNACLPEGKELRDDARQAATISTVSAIAGGALLAAGVTLLLTSPSRAETGLSVPLRLRAAASPEQARLVLEGRWQ